MRYAKYVIVTVLLASIISITPNIAFSEHFSVLSVQTDRSTYGVGDTVVINGTVTKVEEGAPVTLQVFNPRNVMYTIDQAMLNEDRTFSTSIKIGGKLGISGTYTVKATYTGLSAQDTFEFSTTTPAPIRIGGFEVKASLSNGNVDKIAVDQPFRSLIVRVSTDMGDGALTITLPRDVLDAKLGDMDDEFIVLVDNDETEFKETSTTAASRTLSIPVPAGTSEIEIIGTSVIPEFGIIAALVLAIAVGAIIVVSRKNQILSILPR